MSRVSRSDIIAKQIQLQVCYELRRQWRKVSSNALLESTEGSRGVKAIIYNLINPDPSNQR